MKLLSIARPRLCRLRTARDRREVVAIRSGARKVYVIGPNPDQPPEPPKAA